MVYAVKGFLQFKENAFYNIFFFFCNSSSMFFVKLNKASSVKNEGQKPYCSGAKILLVTT